MAWDADSLNKIAGALNDAYSPDQVFRALNFTGHTERECGEHRSTGPRAWCHDCCEWCYPEEPCKGCELPQLRANVAELADEVRRLRIVEEKAQAYVMAGLCGNPDTRAELTELIEVARTDR